MPDPKSSSSAARLESALSARGLLVLGALAARDAEGLGAAANHGAAQALLIGNAGPAMWRVFAGARAADAGLAADPNPMDAWTRRVVTAAVKAAGNSARAVFPFEGPPYYPFQRWALRTGAFHASPVGPLVHAEFGLWAAFRAAVIIDAPRPTTAPPGASPCQTCAEKPCLSSCPVNAFSGAGYDVPACTAHLADAGGGGGDAGGGAGGGDCMGGGCLARRACPYGRAYAHEPAHAAFHMEHFLRARRA